MMSGKERREEILQRITNSKTPVSGAALAKSCEVSRQVIVQDIALIRAAGYDVIATNRGYICSSPVRETRVFEVNHTDEQMQDELNTIVDFGGVVLDVIVRHVVYGELRAELNISSRNKVALFMEEIRQGKSRPLKNITSGEHFHTVSADSAQTLEYRGLVCTVFQGNTDDALLAVIDDGESLDIALVKKNLSNRSLHL